MYLMNFSKYLKYLIYILRHKYFVFLECCKYNLYLTGLLHDLSKFSPSEFVAYANWFYGDRTSALDLHGDDRQMFLQCYGAKDPKLDFDMAWLHHQHNNRHHWQYYILKTDDNKPPFKFLPMPRKYIIEMVSDWRGAGMAIRGVDNTLEWYSERRDIILLEDNTRKQVEELIGYTDEKVQQAVG